MEELYAEAGCKPAKTEMDTLKKTGLIVIPIVLSAVYIVTDMSVAAVLAVIAAVGVFKVLPMLDIEYEYIFCDGQLDFDKILGGERRKTALKIDFEQVEMVVPEQSHAANGWHDGKVIDFSSGKSSSLKPENKKYVILCRVKGQRTKIYFEPTEKMLQKMKMKEPKKVEIGI